MTQLKYQIDFKSERFSRLPFHIKKNIEKLEKFRA
jgi:hypothetical protein